jgi:Class III cytochrome C family
MTSRAHPLATVVLLAAVALACGKREAQPPATTRPASPTPGVGATQAPAAASSPAAPAPTPLPADTARSAVPATAWPPATAAPGEPVATPATPKAPPAPAAKTAGPPPTPPAEKPAVTAAASGERPAEQRPGGQITLPGKLGAVTFDHERHAGKRGIVCTTCHHPSRPQQPLASEHQACRDCHTMPAAPPMKTSLQAAFHDPRAARGTCIDCHRQKGSPAPVKCLERHKKKVAARGQCRASGTAVRVHKTVSSPAQTPVSSLGTDVADGLGVKDAGGA